MTGLVRKASLLTACGLVVAAAAMAGVPSPGNSTKPAYVQLVGTSGTNVADPGGSFTVTVRDFNNVAIVNSQVVVDFINCFDSNLCSAVVGAVTLDCPSRTVRGFTDGTGSITFDILGAANNLSGQPGAAAGCANIIADGVSLVHPTVLVWDENGRLGGIKNGTEATDLASMINDFGQYGGFAIYKGRSDFNQNAAIDGTDLALLISKIGSHNSVNGCPTATSSTYCP